MLFENITYLQQGSPRQQRAFEILTKAKVLHKLKAFDPILVGTIPINIDIESSDLDIICYATNKELFIDVVTTCFQHERSFILREQQDTIPTAIVANFMMDDFEIEIFGQDVPSRHQNAYRHMIAEHNLLNKYGEPLRQEVIELKRKGHKTEPAFALALGLSGDPYKELLKFEHTEE